MRTFLLCAAMAALVGCDLHEDLGGGTGGNASTSGTGGTSHTGTGGAATTGTGAGASGTSGTTTGGATGFMPAPPQGSTLCGQGDLQPADLVAGCNASPMLDEMWVLDRQCGAVTTTGAHWEAWCSTSRLDFLWIELQGAATTGSYLCNAILAGQPSSLMELTSGGSGFGGPFMAKAQVLGVLGGNAQDAAVYGPVDAGNGPAGNGHAWLGAVLDGCSGDGGMSEDAGAIVAGFDFTWNAN
jgi:hypothetical protein